MAFTGAFFPVLSGLRYSDSPHGLPINVLLCAAPEDHKLQEDLAKHLKTLVRNKLIRLLNERLEPGLSEAEQLLSWAGQADVVLLLLSKDLLATLDENIVAARAIERYRLKQVRLIPVMLYEVNWRNEAYFGGLSPLPADGRAVGEGSRADRDAAFTQVTIGVHTVASQVQNKHQQDLEKWQLLQANLLAQQARTPAELLQLSVQRPTEPVAKHAGADFVKGRALLIGVGADLPTTVADAEAIYDRLTDRQAARYPQSQVTLLTGTDASGAKILEALQELSTQAAADDTVFIYFSGHGWLPDPAVPVCYLVPNDFFPTRDRTRLISGARFAELILAIKSRKLLLFLDCCFAGALAAKSPGGFEPVVPVQSVPIPLELLERLGSGAGRVIMASSQPNEVSLAGQPYSVFTASLLEALRTPGGPDGYVSVLDVLRHLFAAVPQRSGGKQHPYLTNLAGLSENFVICYAGPPDAAKTSISANPSLSLSPIFAPPPVAPQESKPPPVGKVPTGSSLRQLIDAMLPNDSRLEAFCIDEYLDVKRQFSQGMPRDQKVNLLFEEAKPQELVAKLADWDDKKFAQHQGLLKFKAE